MKVLHSGTVTFLFTDIEGSTKLWEQHPEEMKAALAKHDSILKTTTEAHHGYIIKTTGDGIHAVFETALDAINAAIHIQRELHSPLIIPVQSFALKVRMGIHTGEAELRGGDYYGGTLNRAARIMSAAHGGQILLSNATAEIIREQLPAEVTLQDMGEHRLKDLTRPEHIFQLNHTVLPNEFPPIKTLAEAPNNLPVQLTSFIGREKQLDDLICLITDDRILTLIGPGGTGKTRLSLQLAEMQLPHFKHGVWFIELASITDPAYIPSAIASVFNLREVQGISLITVLIDYLRGKQMFLIFDNCEHLVEACAQIADQLLQECPDLKILASSREALGIQGEAVYRVPSLKEDEATRLFIERATKADSRFQATESNAPFIAQICSRLDGIPLAIELAAARVKLFSPQQIAERLDDRFKLLTGGSRTALPRQQTLRALIDWSYQTLNETEQRTLRRLAVFSGGWTFEAAEAVVGEAEAMDGLAGLVNKSLVNVDERENVSRYSFLESIRQYAMEKLAEAGEANDTRRRHLEFMLGFVTQAKPTMFGLEIEWLNRVDGERDNLRAALEWSINNDIAAAIDLAMKIGVYWSTRDLISEAIYWYRALLQMSERHAGFEFQRANIYSMLGWASILLGQHREGRAAAEVAIELARRSNADRALVFSYCTVALSSTFLRDFEIAQTAIDAADALARAKGLQEELALVASSRSQIIYFTTRDAVKAKAYLDESIQLSRELGSYRWETAFQVFGQGRLAAALGDVKTAITKFAEGAEYARRVGNKRMVYSNRSETAHVLREFGQLDEALDIYKEVIPGWKELGHRAALAHELECIGYILSRKEDPKTATCLIAAAQLIRKTIDMPRTKLEDVEYEKEIETLKSMLSADEFQMAWLSGGNVSIDEAIELALRSS